jgi:hypothetical protein
VWWSCGERRLGPSWQVSGIRCRRARARGQSRSRCGAQGQRYQARRPTNTPTQQEGGIDPRPLERRPTVLSGCLFEAAIQRYKVPLRSYRRFGSLHRNTFTNMRTSPALPRFSRVNLYPRRRVLHPAARFSRAIHPTTARRLPVVPQAPAPASPCSPAGADSSEVGDAWVSGAPAATRRLY